MAPTTLTSLSPREAILDAVNRSLYGIDFSDRELWNSAWTRNTDEAIFDMGGNVLQPKRVIDERIYDRIAPLETHHNISNIRIDVKDGAKTAYLSVYAVAYHYRPGEGVDPKSQGLTSGVMYYVDLEREEGITEEFWRIKKWVIKFV